MWHFVAFAALGFLIGQLAGMTASSVTSTLLGLLFAFGGGTAIAFAQKVDAQQRALASKAIVALSLFCILGMYVGIYVSEHQLLTPPEVVARRRATPAGVSIADEKYMRSSVVALANDLRQRIANRELTKEAAARELVHAMQAAARRADQIHAQAERGEIAGAEAYRQLEELAGGGQ